MSFSFIYGFPKDLDNQKNLIQSKTNISAFCELNKILIDNTSNCKEEIINIPCGDIKSYVFPDKRTNFQNNNFFFPIDDRFRTATLQKGSESITVKGYAECFYYINKGYSSPYKLSNLRIPIINICVFIILLFSLIVSITQKKK